MGSKIGWILMLGGVLVALSIFIGVAPLALATLPVPFWGWFVVSAVGAVVVMLNRRPGN